jgi:hypothetical protein
MRLAAERDSMMRGGIFLAAGLTALTVTGTAASATCNISDANLEQAIQTKPELRAPANRQMVRDLRVLRDAALIMWSYGRHDDCERLLSNIRELVEAPSMGEMGNTDEDEADQQFAASEPAPARGGQAQGRRQDAGARPLVSINELAPGLRADEIIGTEVRSSDDEIIGEVRNIVFGTKDRKDYAIVASGGFFTIGKASLVVPIPALRVTQERDSFFLPMAKSELAEIPLMPDDEYKWLLDEAWRAQNDARFGG